MTGGPPPSARAPKTKHFAVLTTCMTESGDTGTLDSRNAAVRAMAVNATPLVFVPVMLRETARSRMRQKERNRKS